MQKKVCCDAVTAKKTESVKNVQTNNNKATYFRKNFEDNVK